MPDFESSHIGLIISWTDNSLVFRTTSIPLQDMELRKMRLKVFIFKSKLHYVKSTLGAWLLMMKCQEYPKVW